MDVDRSDAGVDAAAPDAAQDPAIVVTSKGAMRGTLYEKSRAFLGIPYARPPVGALRWVSPQPAEPWTEVRDATQMGPGCYQPQFLFFQFPMSEDCLTLNVWTPQPRPASPVPVIVFVHGGNYDVGSSAQPEFEGRGLAERTGKIVVTINYRLGPFGFLVHPSLKPETGNFGILDQQAALKWVNENIAAFGGDPENVTITGNSAGGWSMCLHLTAPGSRGLFRQVAMLSCSCLDALRSVTEAEPQGAELAASLGCDKSADTATCLRSKDAKEVAYALPINAAMAWGHKQYWRPVVDGTTVTDQPLNLVKAGKLSKVPVMLGLVKDEGTLLIYLEKFFQLERDEYVPYMSDLLGPYAAETIKRYPVDSFSSPPLAISAAIGDAIIDCYARRSARALAAAGVPTYLYQFTGTAAYQAPLSILGSYHTLDLFFLFGNPIMLSPTGWQMGDFTAKEKMLSEKMMDYLGRFASTGDPNGQGATPWPAYTEASRQHLVYGLDGVQTGSDLKRELCDYWDSLPPAVCGNGGWGARPLP